MGLREQTMRTVYEVSGRHDEPDLYGGPPGDPGLCGGPTSVSWEVNGDLGAVATAGVAAIVLEILHPSVVAGVQDHSNYRRDPFRRARTTMGYVLGTTFGNTAAATRLIDGVRNRHATVSGARPDGHAYRALDPKLLAWVHTCIPWMVMTAFERFNRPLTPAERDRYLAEQAVIGRMSGADAVPESIAELTDFVAEMRPKLAVTEQTRTFIDFLLTAPFLPPLPGPLDAAAHHFYVRAGMTLAPEWARKMTGLELPPPLHPWATGAYLQGNARMIRWASEVPPHVALATQRFGSAAHDAALNAVAHGNAPG
ncbi:oxygenase MpaB family protein [Mycolicibacterium arseniciresistens]|uniref:Oxygenase MpaB family protein n=1 Tax=Mycolicibacterium arseniciresistens TaxID=3062257 RepID=A0ABT8UJ06_9MYCO|nr:oxygenase MpaB family protein [Mycolicibacterium arseniciresistens]MDO3637136.1 oxygenase MpaB family protein [Mycolicibacterium arseniciresistens]